MGAPFAAYVDRPFPCAAAPKKALARALANLDASDPTQLEAIAKPYDEIGAATKATVFRERAKNRRR